MEFKNTQYFKILKLFKIKIFNSPNQIYYNISQLTCYNHKTFEKSNKPRPVLAGLYVFTNYKLQYSIGILYTIQYTYILHAYKKVLCICFHIIIFITAIHVLTKKNYRWVTTYYLSNDMHNNKLYIIITNN